MDAVLLPWSFSEYPAELKRHRSALESLDQEGRCAWIRLTLPLADTRFRLAPVEHTFPESGSNEAIQRELRQWHSPRRICFDRIYLVAQEHVKETCYDITDYIERCLSGDYSIAGRLRGRTIFGLHQIETDAYDLLSASGKDRMVERFLKPYTRQFPEFIGNAVLGFCCQLPPVLSPLDAPASTVPWSPDLEAYFQSIWGERFTENLPLIFYGAYEAAAVRSAFWNGLTRQFSEACIGGCRRFCHRLGLKFAIEIPARETSLGFDIGTILNNSDGAILVGANGRENADDTNRGMAAKSTSESGKMPGHATWNASPIDTPKRFLIAKWIASRGSAAGSRVIGIWRSKPPIPVQVAFDRLSGFNSWLANGRESADERNLKKEAKNGAVRFTSLIGQPERSVLIISPLHSLWSRTDGRTWSEIIDAWGWLCQTVWNLGYDFDIVTENECADAKFDKKSRSIRVNAGRYRVILVPSCASLQEHTVSLLKRVIAGRGKLIVVEPVPYLFNGNRKLDTHQLELLLYHQRTSLLRGTVDEKTDTLKQLLAKWIKPELQVYVKPDNIPTSEIRFQHRQADLFDLFYLFNASQSSIDTLIEIRGEAVEVEEWGTTNDEKTNLDFWVANGNTYLNRSFDCWQSRLVMIRKKGKHPQL